MDMDEDDDFYAPEESKTETKDAAKPDEKPGLDELEEGEEEDEGAAMDEDDDDSDIDIITERKDGTKAAPPQQSKYSDIRNIPQRTTTSDSPVKAAPPVKKDEDRKEPVSFNIAAPSADKAAEAASKSTIDINANPIHTASGKRITQVNIDEDLPDNEKPWRQPGTDITDYFNYGFDEFTWALYAAKQEAVRGEFGADSFASNNKKMMEDFSMMMGGGMGGMGGMGASNATSGAAGGGMPGMEGMPPEMQAMMQQMMGSGMDPSQMDPSQMNAMFAGMQNAGGNANAQGGQGQNFGGGFGGNQGGFGYDQNMGGGGGGGGQRGGFGRGRRGRW